jgi:hydrogenase maturation protein HypF
VIGVALDGTGFGPDGTVWGGEFLVADFEGYERAGHLKQYAMPGGDEAVVHPPRMALSYLRDEIEDWAAASADVLPGLRDSERNVLATMISKGVNAPLTSSAGRLFDAVSAMLGLCDEISYEGQAAIRLQTAAVRGEGRCYPFTIDTQGGPRVLSFGPMVGEILKDMRAGRDIADISASFHETVAAGVAALCDQVRDASGISTVCVSGGVFQNALLLSLVTGKLNRREYRVHAHHVVPPNDGGIALGQAAIALADERKRGGPYVPCRSGKDS